MLSFMEAVMVSQAIETRLVSSVFTDGGVWGRNPSVVGGSWAYVYVDAHGDQVSSDAGILRSGELDVCGLQIVSNNTTELMAVVYALENLPDGWSGQVGTDSQVTIHRMKKPGKEWKGVPLQLRLRAGSALSRLGRIEWLLLGGHPNAQELKRGRRADGFPVSHWNVFCDAECNRVMRESRK